MERSGSGLGERRRRGWSAGGRKAGLLPGLAVFLAVQGSFLTAAPAAGKESWWALQPLRSPPVPAIRDPNASVRNPIDAFIQARLAEKRLAPSPETGQRVLIRRVYFDLTGLPPSPQEIRAFLDDASPDGYERAVDRLLNSPRYGERWARHWMDAVHFAETHGHDQDRIREHSWPYRDYLIASFSADQPYGRFLQEQVAGDALFLDDPQAAVALGFLAAGPWDESSLRDIREDTIDRQIGRYLDRDDIVTTVMQTFTSTTIQCARCHDHKFDPITQRDYYALQAVFAGVDKADRAYDAGAAPHRRRRELLLERRLVERGDRTLLLSAAAQRQVEAWEEEIRAGSSGWKVVESSTFLASSGSILTRRPDGSLLAGGPRPERDTYTVTAPAALPLITAVRLEVLADASLPQGGPGRQDNGNFHLSEFLLAVFEPGAPAPRPLGLAIPTADFDQESWTIAHALDGNEATAWGVHPRVGVSHRAVFELKEPLEPPPGATLVFQLKQLHGGGHLIGRFRLSITSARRPAGALPAEAEAILSTAPERRSEAQRAELAALCMRDLIARELASLPEPSLVYAVASDFKPDGGHKPAGGPRAVFVLQRGDIARPLESAAPGALACVPALPARFDLADPQDEGARRAALARWLAHPDNPLTWRSIVNRVWHYHFGRGLVETPNDFGRMGGAPSHPDLLDWLAVACRDEMGGSLKRLHRLIVTSATYRQTSSIIPPSGQGTAAAAALDSENRLLWRMNRARLDAEEVRDAVLLISGRLDLRMGGPSDRQFDLKPGIHVTPLVDYAKFDVDSGAGRRRSVYRFLFRTLPDPFMEALDCPAGDQLAPARGAGVTVQQALAMWNGAFIGRHAEHLAARLEREAGGLASRIDSACEWIWGRPPGEEEGRHLADYAGRHGLANLCRLLFNSNEFLFVN